MKRANDRTGRNAANAGMAAVRAARDDACFQVQKNLLADAAVIFDIGGHHGQTSARYRDLYPDASIHYFEPQPKAAARARKLLQDPDIRINEMAVSNRQGETEFHITGFTAASSLQAAHENAGQNWPAAALQVRETLTVPVTSVDAYCAEQGIENIDILKIDVQGHEFSVLEGAGGLLAGKAVGLVYFEYIHCETYQGQRDLAAYFALMDGYGYRLASIFNLVQGGAGLNQCDLLFQAGS